MGITKSSKAELYSADLLVRWSPLPACLSTLDTGIFLEVNDSFEKLSGYSSDELTGHSATELALWAVPFRRSELVNELSHSPSGVHRQIMTRDRSGRTWILNGTFSIVEYKGQKCILALFTPAQDPIDGVDHYENSRIILNAMSDVAFLISIDGHVLEINDAFMRWLEKPRSEVLGRSYRELLPPHLVSVAEAGMAQVSEKRQLYTMDFRADRRLLHLSLYPVFENGQLTKIAVTSRDVTRELEFEAALQTEREHLASIFASIQDGLCVLDLDLQVVQVNPTMEQWYGPARQLIGRKCYSIHDGQEPCENCPALHTIQTGKTAYVVLPKHNQLGEHVGWLDVYTFPMRDPASGKLNGVIEYVRDTSERQQQEHELEAVASISAALSMATRQSEMLPIILDQIQGLLHPDGISILIRDAATNSVVLQQGRGVWEPYIGHQIPAAQANRNFQLVAGSGPHLDNLIQDKPAYRVQPAMQGMQAVAGSALRVEDNLFGTLWICRKTPISLGEARILSSIASIASSALHRAELHEQSRRYAEQMSVVSRMGYGLIAATTLEEIYSRMIHAVMEIFPDLSGTYVTIYDPERRESRCAYGVSSGEVMEVTNLPALPLEPPGHGPQSEVIHTRQPLIVNDLLERLQRTQTKVLVGEHTPQSSLFAPMLSKGEVIGVVVAQCYQPGRFSTLDAELLSVIGSTAAVAIQNARLVESLETSNRNLTDAYDATIAGWGRALELRDEITNGHTRRVVDLAWQLGRRLGMSEEELVNLRRGAELHDIGKMGVPDQILLKPGELTSEEWKIMRMHPVYAYEMLNPISYFQPYLEIPYCHHERWNGSGYPRGLKEEEIPISARIFAVVDVWDALLSARPYRDAWSRDQVLAYISENAGALFDPQIVPVFIQMLNEMPH